MTNDKEIKKWREKLRPYITAVETMLYFEQKKREDLMKLKEKCKRC